MTAAPHARAFTAHEAEVENAIRFLGYARDATSSMLRQNDLCRAAEALIRAGYPNHAALVTEAAERIGGDDTDMETLLAELLVLWRRPA